MRDPAKRVASSMSSSIAGVAASSLVLLVACGGGVDTSRLYPDSGPGGGAQDGGGRDAARDGGGGDGAPEPDATVGPGGVCPALQIRCGDVCVVPSTDVANCGACGNRCGTGATCTSGVCTCLEGAMGSCVAECRGEGLRACDGACVDTSSSVLHCGECGRACEMDELCVRGDCRTYRPAEGCSRCPCDACDGACCTLPGTPSLVCLAGERCP